jgi:hypothetical protein
MQREEVEDYVLRLPGDAPIRFETVFPMDILAGDLPGARNRYCASKIEMLHEIDLQSILGYRCVTL